MVMKKRTYFLLLILSGFLFCLTSFAGDINQPTHLPNDARNKINQVRLKGLVADEEFEGIAKDAIGSSDLNLIEQYGCSVNIGNTVADNSVSSGDRDVIVTGDVINFCK